MFNNRNNKLQHSNSKFQRLVERELRYGYLDRPVPSQDVPMSRRVQGPLGAESSVRGKKCDIEVSVPNRLGKERCNSPGKRSPARHGQTSKSNPGLGARMKLPKVAGADLYVIRLTGKPPKSVPTLSAQNSDGGIESLDDCCSSTSSTSALLTATESRPCYRCVSYMHSVGIKRVFWSNCEGKWESAKLRDLVDGPYCNSVGGKTMQPVC